MRTHSLRPCGFTLLEVLTACIIVVILSVVAMGNYHRSREVAYGAHAYKTLTHIRNAQILHGFDKATYTLDLTLLHSYENFYDTDPIPALGTLNWTDRAGRWKYVVNSLDYANGKFKILATRLNGPFNTQTILLDQNQAIFTLTPSSWPDPS